MSQADDVLGLAQDVFGTDLIGAYLHGSSVLGGLRPHSDLDVLVVSRRRTTVDERRALVERLLEISGSKARGGPARPIELTIVVQSDVRPWRYPPRVEFQYGEWLRDAYERGETPSPEPSPDLAPLLTMTLLGNRPLFGPPPAEVLDAVPDADLRKAIVEGIPGLLADLESDTRNVILTLTRIWSTLATGDIRSKDGAADWVLPHLSARHQMVVARARAIYVGDKGDRWDDVPEQVRAYAREVVAEIERLAARDA
jgi:streptomycin 3"-adenylyltransferase